MGLGRTLCLCVRQAPGTVFWRAALSTLGTLCLVTSVGDLMAAQTTEPTLENLERDLTSAMRGPTGRECREPLEVAADLAAFAVRFVDLAADTSRDFRMRAKALEDAGLVYLALALPACGAEGSEAARREPNEYWGAYVAVAWRYYELAWEESGRTGEQSPDLLPTRLLHARAFLSFLGSGLLGGPLTAEYAKPGRALFERGRNALERVQGASLAAMLTMAVDWDGACWLANQAYEVEVGAVPSSAEEAVQLRLAMEGMVKVFDLNLMQCAKYAGKAVSELLQGSAGDLETSLHQRPESLWPMIEPCMRRAVQTSGGTEMLDVSANRLLTVPGLRVADIEMEAGRVVGVQFERAYWDDYTINEIGVESKAPPWLIRDESRRARLARPGGADDVQGR